MKKIEWSKKVPSLAQIYRSGLEMAFVSPEKPGRQACDFVLCKDFFQDAIQGALLNQSKGCFGFMYHPSSDPPLSFDKTRIVLGNKDETDLESKVIQCVDFLNSVEKKMHLLRTKHYKCETAPEKYKTSGCYLLEGSSKWMLSPPMISLYTLFIRVGFVHTIGDSYEVTLKKVAEGKTKAYECGVAGSNDRGYLNSAMKGIDKIIKHGYAKIFHRNIKDNYPAKVPMSTLHNSTGIVGFSNGSCKSYFPHWYRMDTPKKKVTKVKAKAIDK